MVSLSTAELLFLLLLEVAGMSNPSKPDLIFILRENISGNVFRGTEQLYERWGGGGGGGGGGVREGTLVSLCARLSSCRTCH